MPIHRMHVVLLLAVVGACAAPSSQRVPLPCVADDDCGPGDSCVEGYCPMGAPLSGDPAAATSTLSIGADGLPASGRHQTTIRATFRDASGVPAAGRAVTISSTGTGNIFARGTSGTTNYRGEFITYLATVVAEPKTVTARTPSAVLTGSVTFVPDQLSASASSLTASPATIPADGTTAALVTVTVVDMNGNVVPGRSISLSASGRGNTFAPASGTTDAQGRFTSRFTSTVAEAKTLTANVPTAFRITQTVQVAATALSQSTSQLALTPASVPADGVHTATLTVTARDGAGNALAGQSVQLAATGSQNTFTPATGTTDAKGLFVARLASAKAETKTVTAQVGAVALSGQVTFTLGNPSTATSTVECSPQALAADGVSATTVRVTVRDVGGNALAGRTVTLYPSGAGNVLSAPSGTTDQNGVFTAALASRAIGPKTVQANASGWIAGSVTFTAAPDAVRSTLTASRTLVPADGSSTTLTLTVRDAAGAALAGQQVVLAASGAQNTLTPASGATDQSGVFRAQWSSLEGGAKTVTATVGPAGPSRLVFSVPVQFQAVPDAPTGVSAAAATLGAVVTWSAPAANGSPITSYTVTASPGGQTATVSAPTTQATVSGLSYGTSYTFTVRATNAAGVGAASSPSNAVQPNAAVFVVTGNPASTQTFNAATVGQAATPDLTLTVANEGNITGTLAAPTIQGTNAGDFRVASNGCASVAAAASCSVVLRFVPLAAGARTATATVADRTFTLNGTGNARTTTVAIGPRQASLIPRLTSNSALGYTTSGSSLWSNAPYWQYYFPFAADANGYIPTAGGGTDGGWLANDSVGSNQLVTISEWLRVDMPSAQAFTKVGIGLATLNQYGYPVDLAVQGSNDGTAWTTVGAVTGLNTSNWVADWTQMTWITFASPGSFTKYRVFITRGQSYSPSWSSGAYIRELSFR